MNMRARDEHSLTRTGRTALGKSDEGGSARGTSKPLVSAQFDFYRHLPMFWEPLLHEIRTVGFSLVSTFVCWDFHEVETGVFDFSGSTDESRNLHRFLTLCQEMGLQVWLRPGPIIDDEWPTRGPARDVCTLERSDPRFRDRARGWLEAVARVICEREVTAGGPVALVQVDNEVFYPHCTEASATESDASFHIPYQASQVLSDFRAWMQTTDAAQLLNLDSDLGKRVMAVIEGREPAWTPRFAEASVEERSLAFDFIGDMIGAYHGWAAEVLRAAGVRAPIVANVKHGLAYFDWHAISVEVDLLGCNNYFDDPRSPEEFLNLVWWYGLQRTRLGYSWAPEFWCGKWLELGQDTSIFDPHHYEYVVMLGLAAGLRGANFFMFVERDDWHYSPLNAIAKPRPNLLQPFSRILPLMSALRDDERLATVGLAWSIADHQSLLAEKHRDWTTLSATWWEDDRPKEYAAWWDSLRSLVDGDVDFRIVDASRPDLAGLEYVVYAGVGEIPEELFAELGPWMAAGGTLVISGDPEPGVATELPAQIATRTVVLSPQRLADGLEAAGAESFTSADRPGVWSTSYEGSDYIVLFIVNRTHRPLPVVVKLSERFCEAVARLDENLAYIERTGRRGEVHCDLDAYSVVVRSWGSGDPSNL